MLLRRDLQNRRDGLHVRVDGVPDHLCDELVDQDDADVVPRQEAPADEKVLLGPPETRTRTRKRTQLEGPTALGPVVGQNLLH